LDFTLAERLDRLGRGNVMDVQEIKDLVDAGIDVRCNGGGYQVIKDSAGQYLICYGPTGDCVGLHGLIGTPYENRLNGSGFYFVDRRD
jgi:hypothetical protein